MNPELESVVFWTLNDPWSVMAKLGSADPSVITNSAAGSLVIEALAVSVKAVSTVNDVFDAIAVTLLVSAFIVMRSPTCNSDRKTVPVPTSVVDAVGSAVPVRVDEPKALTKLEPDCKFPPATPCVA